MNGLYNENIELFKDNSHSMVRIVSNENKIQHENIKQFTLENWFQNYKEMVKNRFYTIEQDKRFDESLENSLYFDKSSEWLNLIYKDDFKNYELVDYQGLGFIDLNIYPHFDIDNKEYMDEVFEVSKYTRIIGLPNESFIRIKDNDIDFVGKHYFIENGVME